MDEVQSRVNDEHEESVKTDRLWKIRGILIFALILLEACVFPFVISIIVLSVMESFVVACVSFVCIFVFMLVLLIELIRKYKPYEHKRKMIAFARKQLRKEQREAKRAAMRERSELVRQYSPAMSGEQYEYYIAKLLASYGFKNIKVTKSSGDYGVDVLAEKNGHKVAVQCKHYQGSVGVEAVQEVYSGKQFYACDMAVVITNSRFTPAAKNLAAKNGVKLIEYNDLSYIDRIEELNAALY